MSFSDTPVPLARRFVPIQQELNADENQTAAASMLGLPDTKNWADLVSEYRTVVLADAGAGKTFEMKAQASKLRAEGRSAFFLRIEDIVGGIAQTLEVGTPEAYHAWRNSTDDGWFFLDSVDEAKLDSYRTFEKAVRRFANEIHDARHRAHITLSSRPYAWATKTDGTLVEELLPFDYSTAVAAKSDIDNGEANREKVPIVPDNTMVGSWRVYKLAPLGRDDVRLFAKHRSIPDVDELLLAIERADLWSMAERPFDLEDIFHKWRPSEALGSRLEILRYGIRRRLQEIDEIRADRQPLNIDRALAGARRLAAAVTLTKQAGIRVPDGLHSTIGIDAAEVLGDWEPGDVKALLSRAIFNDAIYGAVRFRHREVRELLTAEWLHEQITSGRSHREVEALIFRNQYGEAVIRPTMRAILPWLILFNSDIRTRTLKLLPEIAAEGGDTAQLPLAERRRLLADIVARIATDEGDDSVRDNGAIARIAQHDLSQDVWTLIKQYGDHDEVMFFLGRLVWQGKLTECIDLLLPIATDPARGIYARIASVRAILAVDRSTAGSKLWDAILASPALLPRRLLTELISSDQIELDIVARVLSAIDRLAPRNRFEATGLPQSLHRLVDRFDTRQLAAFADGLNAFLDRPPYIEQSECEVSQEYAWLIGLAAHVAGQLIAACAEVSLEPAVISILTKLPALRYSHDRDGNDYKTKLAELVPAWPELNDKLYWANIRAARVAQQKKKSERLTDDWGVAWDHLWKFDRDGFERLLGYIDSEPFLDDKLVALSRACRVFLAEGKPKAWCRKLRAVASIAPELTERLEQYLKPRLSEDHKRWIRRESDRKRRHAEQERKKAESRRTFVERLKADPSIVRRPPGLEPGEFSSDQYYLMSIIEGEGLTQTRTLGANWRALVPEFGKEVARAYRDAAVAHWRAYRPSLGSEGVDTQSVPYALVFAMVGLNIEAAETEGFPAMLTEEDAKHALRYFGWELNGFPQWLEPLIKAFPDLGHEAVWTELSWELTHTQADQPLHYILHDIVYHAPWLHGILAPRLLNWLDANQVPAFDTLRYVLHILISGEVERTELAELAKAKINGNAVSELHLAHWYALWVDCDPDSGVPAATRWLDGITDFGEASRQAQLFITTLEGSDRRSYGLSIGAYRTAEQLKALYVLMHRFIRVEDDIDRAGKGAYSPELRDDAQDGRNALFNHLSEIRGKPAYTMLTELAHDHPNPNSRRRMAKRAMMCAITDSDLEPWTPRQVYEFAHHTEHTPATHRQLFDLAVSRLQDFKDWLERGNDSPAKTYQRVEEETEMRNLVAGWLNLQAQGRYTAAQEAEYANAQRSDIWIQASGITSAMPIELKLADNWSVPDLCERLRNQLVGDYLRETQASCGIMLLIWQGKNIDRRWQLGEHRVCFAELLQGLEAYWQSISASSPGIEAIQIIGIDLTERERISTS